MTRRALPLLAVLLAAAPPAVAADPDWQPVLADLLKAEKTGFGGLCGVVVDPKTGEVRVNLSDRGTFVSADSGKTWKRAGDKQPKGRTETPGCWLIDPTGKTARMMTALVYGAPVSVSDDGGVTWAAMDKAAEHVDWAAADWTDPKLGFVLALRHESGGRLLASHDGGKTFTEVGAGYGPGWVFDAKTAVVAEAKSKDKPTPNLMRTTDGGKTFAACGRFSPVGGGSAQALPTWKDGTLYWLTEGGLIATADKGETWKALSEVKDARYGPVFGADAKRLFVLTKAGVVESTDGGATWGTPVQPPAALKGVGGLTWLAYDPVGDALYLMKMGSDLYRLSLKK